MILKIFLIVSKAGLKFLGDDKLRIIAIEVAEKVKANATIDWTIRESARINAHPHPPLPHTSL